jgi:dodecin
MSIAKIIEISAESDKGFEDAIRQGIKRAEATIKNIKSAWVKEQQVTVEDGQIVSYRVNLKITFILEG